MFADLRRILTMFDDFCRLASVFVDFGYASAKNRCVCAEHTCVWAEHSCVWAEILVIHENRENDML